MGYYSDVKLITTEEGWKRLDKAVRAVADLSDPRQWWLTQPEYSVPICDGKYILAEWSDIKWYDWDDNEVSVFMQALNNLYQDDIPYKFLRVGEDWNDTEWLEHIPDDYEQYKDMPTLTLKREIEVMY